MYLCHNYFSISSQYLCLMVHKYFFVWTYQYIEGRMKTGDREWNGCLASSTQWTWIWAKSRRQWRTAKPGMLESMRTWPERVNNNNDAQVVQNSHCKPISTPSKIEKASGYSPVFYTLLCRSYFWYPSSPASLLWWHFRPARVLRCLNLDVVSGLFSLPCSLYPLNISLNMFGNWIFWGFVCLKQVLYFVSSLYIFY